MQSDASVISQPLTQVGWLIGHDDPAAPPALLLQDTDEDEDEAPVAAEHQELSAFIRSGDYFGMLATRLDVISDNLHPDNEAEAVILQHIVNNLLYLDQNYILVKKQTSKKTKATL
jgi:hypothetical protein